MTTQEKISIAESVGLVFNEFNDDGEPEFIGTREKFLAYENMIMGEEIHESLSEEDKQNL